MRALLAIAATLALSPAANGATPAPGALTQLPGKAGCVAHRLRASEHCARGRFGGNQVEDVVVSPDGRNVYTSSIGGSVSAFQVRHDGSLRQLRGKRGCLSRSGHLGCLRVPGLTNGWTIAVSADGRSVYVGITDGVFALSRDPRTGALKPLAPYTGRGLFPFPADLAVSPDGRSVYVASSSLGPTVTGALAVFARNRRTGRLSQVPGARGCLNAGGTGGCGTARALYESCCSVAISPDSKTVYVASTQYGPLGPGGPVNAKLGVAAFARDAASGALTQLPGAPGCAADDPTTGCALAPGGDAEPEHLASGLVASADGRSVYLAHYFTFPESEPATACFDYFVAVLRRDPLNGGLGDLRQNVPTCGAALSASPDDANLYTVDGWTSAETVLGLAGGSWKKVACLGGFHCPKAPRGVEFPSQLAVAPDGGHAYLAGNSGVVVFKRRI